MANDQYLQSIKEQLDRIEERLTGDDGLIVRLDRVEQIVSVLKWTVVSIVSLAGLVAIHHYFGVG